MVEKGLLHSTYGIKDDDDNGVFGRESDALNDIPAMGVLLSPELKLHNPLLLRLAIRFSIYMYH